MGTVHFKDFERNHFSRAPLDEVFRILHLPEPDKNSIARITWGNMLPLEDYGCVLRFEHHYKNIRTFVPYVISPIVQIASVSEKYGDSRRNYLSPIELATRSAYQDVELVPGVSNIGITTQDYRALKRLFHYTTGCNFKADAENDCAYFGPKTREFANGLPVVIDRTDAEGPSDVELTDYKPGLLGGLIPRRSKLNLAWNRLCGELATAELYRQVQIEKYGNLMRLGRDLLTAPEDRRDLHAAAFWSEMRRNVGKKDKYGDTVLGAAWAKDQKPRQNGEQEEKLSAVRSASASYSRILRHDPFHSAILKAPAFTAPPEDFSRLDF